MFSRLVSIIRHPACFILIASILAACKSIAVASPPPTALSLRLAYTPALRTWVEPLAICAEKQPEIAMFLDEIPFNQFDSNRYDATLRLGNWSDSYNHAIVLGYEDLKVIVNDLNPVQSIDENELEDLLDGSLLTWETLSPPNAVYVVSVQPWTYLPESEITWSAVLDNDIEEKPNPMARLASDPGQVVLGVREDSGAIGLVPGSWIVSDAGGIKSINFPTIKKAPVLAITHAEPHGALQRLLGCLSDHGK